jgi:guanylate kinase
MLAMRESEGAAIAVDLTSRIADLRAKTATLAARREELAKTLAANLRERIRALFPDVPLDPGPAGAGGGALADRSDVAEELPAAPGAPRPVRGDARAASGGPGQDARFLTQEILRELNTLGSKSRDLTVDARDPRHEGRDREDSRTGAERRMSPASGTLFIVSSPSGGGKTTLIRRLLAGRAERASTSPSRTRRARNARARRTGASTTSSRGRVREDGAPREFLEHNEVHGNFYGTARAEVMPRLSAGEDVVLDIDVQGARDVRQAQPESVSIFLVPHSAEQLEKRLRRRGLDGEDAIRKRLINAAKEVAQAENFQYVIVNDDLDRASLELESVVRASRLTPARQAKILERLRKDFR